MRHQWWQHGQQAPTKISRAVRLARCGGGDTEAVNLLGIWFTPPEILLGDAAGSSGVGKILHRAARNGQSRWRELLVARYQSGSGNRGRMLWREVPHAFSNRISQARIAGRPDRTGLVDHVLEVLELVKRTIPHQQRQTA